MTKDYVLERGKKFSDSVYGSGVKDTLRLQKLYQAIKTIIKNIHFQAVKQNVAIVIFGSVTVNQNNINVNYK